MKINRQIDGKNVEIELSDAEIEKAYRERDEHYKILDFKAKIGEMIASDEDIDNYDRWCGELPELPENTSERTKKLVEMWKFASDYVDQFASALSDNDSYWESYWLTMENIIEEEVKRNA